MNTTIPSAIVVDFNPEPHSLIIHLCAQFINLTLGLPIHGFTLWLILTGTGTHETLQIFNLNLAVAETLYSLSATIYVVDMSIFGDGLDKAMAFFGGFSSSARPLFQMCVCVERYLAVIHPLLFLRLRPLKYRVTVSAVVWLLVLGISLIFAFTLSFSLFLFYSPVYLFVLGVDLFCCLSVIWGLKRRAPGDRHGEKGQQRKEGGMQAAKKKAMNIILINCLVLMMYTLPFSITLFVSGAFKLPSYLGPAISALFFVVGGFIQPLIYIYKAGKTPFIRCLSNQTLISCLNMQNCACKNRSP